MIYDCLVLGLGGMGSSVLRSLAVRGARVLGIEQFGPVHDRGSSHGRTRIIRKAYFEHPDYVPLLHRAYELWQELEQESSRILYAPCGVLLSGPADGEAIGGSVRSAHEHGLEIERLDSAEGRRRYPLLNIPEEHAVVVERDAGRLFVEECVRAALDSATRAGAETKFHEPVLRWSTDGATVTVNTAQGRYVGRRLVFTAGPWSSLLIGTGVPAIVVRKKLQHWYAVAADAVGDLNRMPAFYMETATGAFYGIPAPADRQLKVARHTGGAVVADPSRVDEVDAEEERRRILEFATQTLRGVGKEPVQSANCMYSMSSDGHFLVDRHPDHANVFIAAGFSGHGFKFAPVIGEALSELVLHDRTALPIGFLGFDRLSKT